MDQIETIKKFDVFVFGYYGRGNLGDDFFIPSLNVLFSKIFSDAPQNGGTTNDLTVQFKNMTVHYLHPGENLPDVTPSLIIVGGGDVLNEYFMSRLKPVFEKFPVKKYAVGVGGDPKYFRVFDGVWTRNSLPGALFTPDLLFLPMIWRATPPALAKRKSSVKFTSPSRRQLNDSLQNLHHHNNYPITTTDRGGLLISLIPRFTAKFLVSLSTLITRLAPSFNFITFVVFSEEQNENNDMPAVEKVRAQFSRQRANSIVKLLRYPVDFQTYTEAVRIFKDHSAAICMRFHSHVLSVIAEIPFISLATSKKCQLFMSENRLPHFKIDSLPDGTPDYFSFQQAEIILRSGMNTNLYSRVRQNIIKLWNSAILTINFDTTPVPEATPTTPLTTAAVFAEVKKFLRQNFATDELNSTTIPDAVTFALYLLTRKTESPYFYGFIDNTQKNPASFESSIQYIIERERCGLNISFIDQTDCWGKHRYGWEWICNSIKTNLAAQNGIRCDLFVDRTFIWMRKSFEYSGIIPYTVPWIGFVHHPPCENTRVQNSLANMITADSFLQSLTTCKTLISFSKYVADYITEKTGFDKILVVKHPAPHDVNIYFNPEKFSGTIMQVGSWLRDEFAICDLAAKSPNHKYLSVGGSKIKSVCTKIDIEFCGPCSSVETMEEHINSALMEKIKLVTVCEKLSDAEFDALFEHSVVFLKMIDCSAVNTILECIMHNTPIFINILPAVVEYLGEDYPLYYTSIDDVAEILSCEELLREKILAAHLYLKNMDKKIFEIDTLISSLRKFVDREN